MRIEWMGGYWYRGEGEVFGHLVIVFTNESIPKQLPTNHGDGFSRFIYIYLYINYLSTPFFGCANVSSFRAISHHCTMKEQQETLRRTIENVGQQHQL